MTFIKHILLLLLVITLGALGACGSGSKGSKAVTPDLPVTPTVSVVLSSFGSVDIPQQDRASVNIAKIVVEGLTNPKITEVKFKVNVIGGYEGFTIDTNSLTIGGSAPSSNTENVLVFDSTFQDFVNNEYALNLDFLLEAFRGFGGVYQITELQVTVNSDNVASGDSTFDLNILTSGDFNTVEIVQGNSVIVGDKNLIATITAESSMNQCDGGIRIHLGEFDENLAGMMYNSDHPDSVIPALTDIDLSMIESIVFVNNVTQEEHVFYGIENVTDLPIEITQDNTLSYSVFINKFPGNSLSPVGVIVNLYGFNDCSNNATLFQNRWKYLGNSLYLYDSYVDMQRMTEDQSGIVENGIEKRIEDYVLEILQCENCSEGIILNNITYNYDSINVDITSSSIKFLINGATLYDGAIVIDGEQHLVFSPNTTLIDSNHLEISVVMSVLDINQTAKFGVYPETITFTIVSTGEVITIPYVPGLPYNI